MRSINWQCLISKDCSSSFYKRILQLTSFLGCDFCWNSVKCVWHFFPRFCDVVVFFVATWLVCCEDVNKCEVRLISVMCFMCGKSERDTIIVLWISVYPWSRYYLWLRCWTRFQKLQNTQMSNYWCYWEFCISFDTFRWRCWLNKIWWQ